MLSSINDTALFMSKLQTRCSSQTNQINCLMPKTSEKLINPANIHLWINPQNNPPSGSPQSCGRSTCMNVVLLCKFIQRFSTKLFVCSIFNQLFTLVGTCTLFSTINNSSNKLESGLTKKKQNKKTDHSAFFLLRRDIIFPCNCTSQLRKHAKTHKTSIIHLVFLFFLFSFLRHEQAFFLSD